MKCKVTRHTDSYEYGHWRYIPVYSTVLSHTGAVVYKQSNNTGVGFEDDSGPFVWQTPEHGEPDPDAPYTPFQGTLTLEVE